MDRAKSRKKAIALSLTVALGLFLWLQHPHLIQNLQADHVAARATREQVTLPDGSSVLLDADSAFSVRFSADERRVSLLRGAAFFEVKPSDVPFVVEAGGGTIRVLGTGFDVRLLDDGASVTLEHGSIALTSGKDATPVILVAGEQADFGAQGVDVGSVVLADALAWRAGRYVFYRARLSDVVHQIGRYRGGRIVIATQALAEARVTGSFALSDTDAALASLQASVGFRMTSLGGLTVIR